MLPEKPPQLKTAYWECSVTSVYINAINDSSGRLRILRGKEALEKRWIGLKTGNGIEL